MKNKILVGILASILILGVFIVAASAAKPNQNTFDAVWTAIQQIQSELSAQSARIDGLSASIDGNIGNLTPTAYDAFIEIDGIPGSSTSQGHENWIELVDFSQVGITAREHGEVRILKEIDKSSPLLYLGASEGQHISEAVLEKDLGNGNLLRYRFHDVILKEVDISTPKLMKAIDKSSPNIWSTMPTEEVSLSHMEEVSFTYATVEWEYVSSGETISAGWDLVENKAV